jgi:hypothetical protein
MFLPKYKEVNPPPIGNKELIKPIISIESPFGNATSG